MAIDVIVAETFIIICSGLSIFFGIFNAAAVIAVSMDEVKASDDERSDDEELLDEADTKGADKLDTKKVEHIHMEKMEHMIWLSGKIKDGAKAFLFKEYSYMIVFCILFGLIIFFLAET